MVCEPLFEKQFDTQLASPKLGWPNCPQCGQDLPISCVAVKNEATVFFGLSSTRADGQTAIFCF